MLNIFFTRETIVGLIVNDANCVGAILESSLGSPSGKLNWTQDELKKITESGKKLILTSDNKEEGNKVKQQILKWDLDKLVLVAGKGQEVSIDNVIKFFNLEIVVETGKLNGREILFADHNEGVQNKIHKSFISITEIDNIERFHNNEKAMESIVLKSNADNYIGGILEMNLGSPGGKLTWNKQQLKEMTAGGKKTILFSGAIEGEKNPVSEAQGKISEWGLDRFMKVMPKPLKANDVKQFFNIQ